MGRPDLDIPLLPDAQEDLGGEYEWPEAGPSKRPLQSSAAPDRGGGGVDAFTAKAAAAMTGAMATSLLMTPFDVLKTRLQTVQPSLRPKFFPPPVECCQTPVLSAATSAATSVTCASSTLPGAPPQVRITPVVAAPAGCYHPSKWAGIWGEAMTFEEAMSRGILGPGGTLSLPRGTPRAEPSSPGFWSEIAAVRRETGIRGLWKGVGTTLTMSIPSSAIYMLGYEYLLKRLSPVFTDAPSATLTPAPLVAGSLARTFSATIISPIEMFRTRLQALPAPGHPSPTYASTGKEMATLVRHEGPSVLWRGLGPTLWRDVPFSGIYWAFFEMTKAHLSSPSSVLPPLSPIATSFCSGAFSGTVAALLTQPFDVLKTRRQVFTPSKDCSPEALRHRASTFPLALHVIRTEGWQALFAGVVPRCGKIAPACGLMIACYEGVSRYLGSPRA
ncbi:Mitochondrial carrier protein MTM1 [Vanrija pseudolonga]|uniref:Mitochondrial carrier protein MTM1 n=1 Tax=Vanrija pseudolonga TaxID=143232 RepID=A0AAF0YFH3_9TREE|nr:Mitochondrial carrier protein MTM1 [Vanrija pseudolonga]